MLHYITSLHFPIRVKFQNRLYYIKWDDISQTMTIPMMGLNEKNEAII